MSRPYFNPGISKQNFISLFFLSYSILFETKKQFSFEYNQVKITHSKYDLLELRNKLWLRNACLGKVGKDHFFTNKLRRLKFNIF